MAVRVRAPSVIFAAVLALALLPGAGLAHAAAFAVDSAADAADTNPGDGVCVSAAGGCTLRAAIEEANILAGPDTISVPAGTFTLSIAGRSEQFAATGDLDIRQELTITGAGAASTIISGNRIERVFHVFNTTVAISDLTIRDGDVGDGDGGGIAVVGSASVVTLSRVLVTNNTAGGIGGGLAAGEGARVTVVDGVFSGNTANGDNGGAIFNGVDSTLVVANSTITGNRAIKGGGIRNRGTATIVKSAIDGNTAESDGGGIATGDPQRTSALTVKKSTISNNRAGAASDNDGGGIDVDGGSVILNQVTISGNAANAGGAIDAEGDVRMTQVTIVGNAADRGGGINRSAGTATLRNSIVANNTAAMGANCSGSLTAAGAITSTGSNLESANTCGFNPGIGDLVNTDPQLSALANNGGRTVTHALLPGSPAIDAVATGCPPPAKDQRGIVRPQDGNGDGVARCDVGAFERAP